LLLLQGISSKTDHGRSIRRTQKCRCSCYFVLQSGFVKRGDEKNFGLRRNPGADTPIPPLIRR